MKSTICSADGGVCRHRSLRGIQRVLAAAIVAVGLCVPVCRACGPWYDDIPAPVYFNSLEKANSVADDNKAENIALWQRLTSASIPASDIEQAVYRDPYPEILYGNDYSPNRFYSWLASTNDREALDFLSDAKNVEQIRDSLASPWFYPDDRYGSVGSYQIEDLLKRCMEYKGTRFRDRYALQAVRLLFSLRRYDRCAEYFETAFAGYDDSNLFKRMARRYAAGSWQRLGQVERANEYFALSGDFLSLKTPDRVAYMAKRNPDCPQLMDYLQRCASMSDTAAMLGARNTALQLLSGTQLKHRGDWEFLVAYTDLVYRRDTTSARNHIAKALKGDFYTDDFGDHARAFALMIDAARGTSPRLEDLHWLEKKTSPEYTDSRHWTAIMQNIICGHWVPALWRKKNYSTAILLASLAEYRKPLSGFVSQYNPGTGTSMYAAFRDVRYDRAWRNIYDYGSLPFKLMGSLSSRQLAETSVKMKASNPVYSFLRRYARLDADYVNELTGTLALREQDYTRAFAYFSKVSPGYQKLMNVYRDGYLAYDPFIYYGTRHRKETRSDSDGEEYTVEYEYSEGFAKARMMTSDNAKLNFARQMMLLQKEMKSGRTADERGLARMRYAIGLRNSFEQCWALTRYSEGYVWTEYTSYIDTGNNLENRIPFLYEYDDSDEVELKMQREIEASMASLASDDAKARAELMLGNVKTIVKRYGDTPTAQYVKSNCDRWRNWL